MFKSLSILSNYRNIEKNEREQVRYNEIMKLHSEGLSNTKIAKIAGIGRVTINDWIRFGIEQTKIRKREYNRIYNQTHKEEIKEYDKIYNLIHKEERKENDRLRWLNNKVEIKKRRRIYYLANQEEIKENSRIYRHNLRHDAIRILTHDTNRCMWDGCIEDRIDGLTVDHKNSGGRKHREKININIYLWLKQNNYPTDDYQVLCANHQMEKVLIYGENQHIKDPTPEQQKWKDYMQKYREKLKWQTLSAYSNSLIPYCKACHTTNFWHLCLDHINGDGAEDRKKWGMLFIYQKLRQLNFPDKDKYQVLCYTCNQIKMFQNGEWRNQYGNGVVSV